jgi:hypothetical protein
VESDAAQHRRLYGRFRLAANGNNDYMIDREKQRHNAGMDDFTGHPGHSPARSSDHRE